ncbi:MAG: peptide chain release factor H [Acidobacteria bacterium]|nr:peptide chain release factor H [Acidobacteriota bacterium]
MRDRELEVWLQITAGQGPAECAWAVIKTLEEIQREALAASLDCRAIEIEAGPQPSTAHSVLLSITGDAAVAGFAESWRGTVQWSMRSPFRPEHKRKNWFVGIEVLEPVDEAHFDAGDVRWETMRASGPGGQHVNRTESAVRVTHVATGLSATAMEERSQFRNRKLALARLRKKIDTLNAGRRDSARAERWRAHHGVERGNPVRVFSGVAG